MCKTAVIGVEELTGMGDGIGIEEILQKMNDLAYVAARRLIGEAE